MQHTNFIPIDLTSKRHKARQEEVPKNTFGWFRQIGFVLSFLLCFCTGIFAQETWTGAVDGDWTNNGNWADNSAPLSGVIAGNGVLTINTTGTAPTTNIPATVSAAQLLVMTPFTIPSATTVSVNGTSLSLDGVVTSGTGNLTVQGTLNVTSANMDGIEIGARTRLHNAGTITVSSSGANGVHILDYGSLVNSSNITILGSGGDGIENDDVGVLDNLLAGVITIRRSGENGIESTGRTTTSGDITIDTTTANNGILNSGPFLNDSLGVITINNVAQDGILSEDNFTNDGGVINIGNGTVASIGDDGIDIQTVTRIFSNFRDVALGGGEITINGVTGDGIVTTGPLNNGSATVGDTLGTIKIDNTNGNGIQLTGTGAGVLTNIEKSLVEVGFNGGNVRQLALVSSNAGTVTNTVSTVRLDGVAGSAQAAGPVTNTGILMLVKTASFTGGLTNSGIIKSTAPASSITGTITNTGLIMDGNNSLGSTLTAGSRAPAVGVTNTSGIIIAPFSAQCYADTVADFLITGLADPRTAAILPSTPFTMPGNPNAATLDTANNVLRLNMIQSLMNFEYSATLPGTACSASSTVSINFANVVSPAVACNNNSQVSLNAACTAVITPDIILEGSHPCFDGFAVVLEEGSRTGQDTVDASYLGQTVRVRVTSPLGNSCWGTITVEDKIAPLLACRDTTVVCGTSTDPAVLGGQPTVIDACNNDYTLTYSDQVETFNCKLGTGAAPDTISSIVRTWRVVDVFGNIATCTQAISVVKPQLVLSDIIWPENDTLYCGDNPNTAPEVTGFPRLRFNGDTVNIDQFCSLGMNFQDQVFTSNCPGEEKISRIWTIFDWCRPAVRFTNAITPGPQIIKVVDTVGPVISNLPLNTQIQITFADLNSCMANVTVPAVTVNDDCSSASDITIKVQAGVSTVNANGGTLINVPFGQQDIIYMATDGCGNISMDTVRINIQDNIAPTVICKENLVVSLTQNGTAQVIAEAFNNGSYDNCAVDSIRVRRMDICGTATELPFANFVDFQCCDIGSDVMVELGVWDESNNFNSCMVRVQVQDKVAPQITCPPDMTVTCETDLTDLSVFGPAAVSGGACNNAPLDLVETRNLDNCGVGTITRTWTIPNTTTSCTQTITVTLVPNNTFNITRMPDSIRLVECGSGLDITNLPQDDLQVESSGCQLLAVSYNQRVFNTTGDCQEVLRTWEIIDWCRNPQANPALPGYQVVTQLVKLSDTISPAFTSTIDTLFVNVDHSSCDASVTLPSFTASDNCATSPSISISGVLEQSTGVSETLVNASIGSVINNVKVGTYRLFYTASDGCNNSSVAPLIVSVRDTEGPTLFCDDLVTTLTLNPDEPASSNNRGWVTVWASDFNCKITDCDTTQVRQLLRFPSQGIGVAGPPADAAIEWTFNCSFTGIQTGDLWVMDGSGNWDYVRVTVDIQDNMRVCPPDSVISFMSAMISGSIETEQGEAVEDVTVQIGGYSMSPITTGIDGNYEFAELPMHNNYTVAPEKNTDPLNGVSTFDLVLISKHILGVAQLDSPYRQIAADINQSGTITAYDLVQLRQLILNVASEFPNNTSWRFVNANYQFTSDNPAAESFTEVASIGDLEDDVEAHFIAVKIGDVNTNAIANRGLVDAEARTNRETLALFTENKHFKAGEEFTVDFRLDNVEQLEGYQFTLDLNPKQLEIVSIGEGISKEANFGTSSIKRGQLTTSWNQGANLIQGAQRMFSLTLKAKEDGKMSEAANLSSQLIDAEAYHTNGEFLNVSLSFDTQQDTESTFTLYNNRPNPFKEATTISFELPQQMDGSLTIFDISGRVVTTVKRAFTKGYNEVQIDKANLDGSGIYFYQLETATHTAKKKMILID